MCPVALGVSVIHFDNVTVRILHSAAENTVHLGASHSLRLLSQPFSIFVVCVTRLVQAWKNIRKANEKRHKNIVEGRLPLTKLAAQASHGRSRPAIKKGNSELSRQAKYCLFTLNG